MDGFLDNTTRDVITLIGLLLSVIGLPPTIIQLRKTIRALLRGPRIYALSTPELTLQHADNGRPISTTIPPHKPTRSYGYWLGVCLMMLSGFTLALFIPSLPYDHQILFLIDMVCTAWMSMMCIGAELFPRLLEYRLSDGKTRASSWIISILCACTGALFLLMPLAEQSRLSDPWKPYLASHLIGVVLLLLFLRIADLFFVSDSDALPHSSGSGC